MKQLFYYSAFLATCALGFPMKSAAQQALPHRKVTTEANSQSGQMPSQNMSVSREWTNTTNQPVRFADRIDTPIRWYALENETNAQYWSAVDASRVWLELDLNADLDQPELRNFLADFGLIEVIGESHNKTATNFYVFNNATATPASIVAMADAAKSISGIKFLEPSVIYRTHLVPNDPGYAQQWGPYVSYFDEAWDIGIGGNSWNVVCVIDDACDWNHEDLFDAVWYGWDYAEWDANISPDDPDSHDHGTHVTGTVAAKINNGIGVAGMVNDTVYFAKVGTPSGSLNDMAIVEAIYDVASISRITAVNMSLGGDAPSAAIEQACNEAWNSGKILIVSSGNNSQGFISFPAAYPSCTAIGSMGADGTNLYLASYSQYGPEQELTATGGDQNAGFGILSTLPLNNYGVKEGTSMAAPHATGLAGLMKNLNMNLTNVDIRNIMASTAFDFGQPGWDPVFGYGLINALGAAQAATGVVSTRDRAGDQVIRLYPNPASQFLLIDPSIDLSDARLDIIDITGKVVKSQQGQGINRQQIDVRDLVNGVYIIRVSGMSGLPYSARFVKI